MICAAFFYPKEITMEQAYKTVKHEANDESIQQKSRFIGYVRPVQTEEEALAFIEEKKKYHWDARHNVYAYVLRDGNVRRFSDDGEPHGSAGVPVLDMIVKSGVTDVVVVVTRYFGGILLGVGGLVRAYTQSAKLALEAGEIVSVQKCVQCRLVCDYNMYGKISSLIPADGGIIDDTDFSDTVAMNFHIPPEKFDTLSKHIADQTCGKIEPEIKGEKFFQI